MSNSFISDDPFLQLSDLQSQVKLLQSQIEKSEEKRKDIEKEQEDLLVLLDEVTSKRRKDKVRLREANLEVSEDEAEDEAEDEDVDTGAVVAAVGLWRGG